MDFAKRVLKFLHFTTVMLKLAAVSENRNRLGILTFYHGCAEVGSHVGEA
jgi:hypothetical protein